MKKKLISALLCTAMAASLLAGCGGGEKKAENTGSKDGNYEDFITVDVYDEFANYQTRSAAGELGDLVLINTSNGKLNDVVEAGLVMDATDLMEGKDIVANYGDAIEVTNEGLSEEGMYFSNFYSQESVGTSSDTEFTYSTSLLPASSGTVFVSYWDRQYPQMPQQSPAKVLNLPLDHISAGIITNSWDIRR